MRPKKNIYFIDYRISSSRKNTKKVPSLQNYPQKIQGRH